MKTVRVNELIAWDTCPMQWKLRYKDKIVPYVPPANLEYGTSVHRGIEAFFTGGDPVEAFQEEWEKRKDTPLRYSSKDSWESLNDCGKKCMEQLPEAWESQQIETVEVESNHRFEAVPGLVLSGTPDHIGISAEGKTVITDFKTGNSVDENWAAVSDQTTGYMLLTGADEAQFCLLPKTKNPKIGFTHRIPCRESLLDWYVKKLESFLELSDNDRHIHRRTLHGFNSPCKLCDYYQLCWFGDPAGLTIRD